MAEHLRHLLEVRASREGEGGGARARIVQPDRRQVGILEQAGDRPGDVVGHQSRAVLGGEHQAGVGPGSSLLQPLLELPDPVQSRDPDGAGVQRNDALAALALGLADLEVGAELQDLPAGGQRRLLQVDLGPAQPDGLIAPPDRGTRPGGAGPTARAVRRGRGTPRSATGATPRPWVACRWRASAPRAARSTQPRLAIPRRLAVGTSDHSSGRWARTAAGAAPRLAPDCARGSSLTPSSARSLPCKCPCTRQTLTPQQGHRSR